MLRTMSRAIACVPLSLATRLARLCAVAFSTILVTGVLFCSDQAGASDSRADALDKAIPAAMARAKGPIPGVIVGVWQDGRQPYVRAFGVRNTATGQSMTTDLYMRIGSNTKTFTVTAILMLADQGKLSLDDPVDFYVKGVPGGEQVTLRQLAQMRSGLYDFTAEVSPVAERNPRRTWAPRELLAIAFRNGRGLGPELQFPPPGSKFDYNNANTVLLGEVVKKVSGQEIGAFITQHILNPLALIHTLYPKSTEFPSPHAHGYQKLADGTIVDATNSNPTWTGAAGQMISTLDDLRVWARALAEGKLISPAMKHEQQTFGDASPDEGVGAKYGLALENQNGWLGHNGNILSYMAFPYYLPEERMTMVVLVNSGADIEGVWHMIEDIASIISPNHPWTAFPPPEGEPTQ
jgi:D-alanyl-D-alanine carboxypeptidase